MALPAATVWEVRTGGSDSNGGGFVAGASGTDYSQQNTAQYSYTDLASSNGTSSSPSVTSASHSFVAADVGNIIQITAGTNWTTGFYQIVSVSAGAATLDRACGSTASLSGGTWAEGGALATPGKAAGAMAGGNVMWIASGTYSITSTSTNVAGGCLSLPAGVAANNTKVIGYGTSRGDDGTKPLLQASGISSFTLITTSSACHLENLSLDGQSLSGSRGILNSSVATRTVLCKLANFTNNAVACSTSGHDLICCEITGCSSSSAVSGGTCYYCVAHANSNIAFNMGVTSGSCVGCIAANNTGSNGYGFYSGGSSSTNFISCLAYGNGKDGFYFSQTSSNLSTAINCRSEKNSGYGYNAGASEDSVYLYSCSGWSNTSGNVAAAVLNSIGFISLTGDPSNNAAGNDFSLNNTAGAGASLRAAGIPGSSGTYVLPGLSTNSYPDVGPAQHKDSCGVLNPLVVQPNFCAGVLE